MRGSRPEAFQGAKMVRTVLSVIAGVVAWIIVVTAVDIAMRHFWPEYGAVFRALTFTLPMMLARLIESTAALIIAAIVTVRIAPASRYAPWAFGIVMLAIFVPTHYIVWAKFPIWYHAYFLSSLVIVPVLTASAARGKAG
jgi:hypothetical protein